MNLNSTFAIPINDKNKFEIAQREISSAGSEHLPYKQGVTGSNPVSPTTKQTLKADFKQISAFFILQKISFFCAFSIYCFTNVLQRMATVKEVVLKHHKKKMAV